jgi:hypothetical protein
MMIGYIMERIMDFPLSSADNRVPMMVRAQHKMLTGLSNAKGGLTCKAQLAAWYYIGEDKNNTPEFVRWIYAAAKANISKISGRQVASLAYGGAHLYRKGDGIVSRHGQKHKINVGVITNFMQAKANTGDSKYIGYIDDLNIWYDTILKLK